MKKSIQTSNAPAAVGPYSQAVQVDNTLYISGQIPLNPETSILVEGDITEQTKQIFRNIEAIIKTTSPTASLQNIIKTTVFLTDLTDFTAVNEVFKEVFQDPYPARSTVQIAALPKGAQIEIESVACTS
jgi:2-iminobutanoate/2-iminopropanoate deaminase